MTVTLTPAPAATSNDVLKPDAIDALLHQSMGKRCLPTGGDAALETVASHRVPTTVLKNCGHWRSETRDPTRAKDLGVVSHPCRMDSPGTNGNRWKSKALRRNTIATHVQSRCAVGRG